MSTHPTAPDLSAPIWSGSVPGRAGKARPVLDLACSLAALFMVAGLQLAAQAIAAWLSFTESIRRTP